MAIPSAAEAAAAKAAAAAKSSGAQGPAQPATWQAGEHTEFQMPSDQFAEPGLPGLTLHDEPQPPLGQVEQKLPGQREVESGRRLSNTSARSTASMDDIVPSRLSEQERERWQMLVRMNSNYHQEHPGILTRIAEHKMFENLTVLVITFNALWIGVDLELNEAASWLEAHIVFKVADNLFCVYFTGEVLIRACAYRPWVHCFFEKELLFDSVLVGLMVLETWVMPIVSTIVGGNVSAQMSQASIFRLLRLLRLTRMIRLMRSFPELVVLIKGMIAALRSVATNFLFLLAGLWVFGIIFLQQYKDVDDNSPEDALLLRDFYFGSLGTSMVTLFVNGTLLDEMASLAIALMGDSMVMLTVLFFFVLLSSLTLLNMLIGVLAEVVATTAEKESDDQAILDMIKTMKEVFHVADFDGDETVTAAEFQSLIADRDSPTVKSLLGIGIDPVHLDSLYQQLFEDEDMEIEDFVCPCGNQLMPDAKYCRKCGKRSNLSQRIQDSEAKSPMLSSTSHSTLFATKQLGFVEFMDALLKLKPCTVSVRDVIGLRRVSICGAQEVLEALFKMRDRLKDLAAAVRDLQGQLHPALAAPVDGTVGVPAAGPVEGTAAQHMSERPPNTARSVCFWAAEGSPPESASPATAGMTELQVLTMHGTAADLGSIASEDLPAAAKLDKTSPHSNAALSRQVQECSPAPTAAHSVRWPPAPVEPLAPLPSLGGPGGNASASLTALALGSNSGQKCESKLSMVPTEMIIEEMARRMLKRIDKRIDLY